MYKAFRLRKLNSFVVVVSFTLFARVFGQTTVQELISTPEKTGGVNYAYPAHEIRLPTPAPDGYEPIYISHFGRHGSRYLVDDAEYKQLVDLFQQADSCDALTALGKDVNKRLIAIWGEAKGKGGELSPLGEEQLLGITNRMFNQHPGVFRKGSLLTAVSTTVGRCIHSMEIVSRRIAELNPDITVVQDADPRHMEYLNHHTKEAVRFRYASDTWKEKYNQFEEAHVQPARMMNSLFSDLNFLNDKITPASLMRKIYNLAGNLQNMTMQISLFDLFVHPELFNLWQCSNYSLYVQYANAAENGGIMMENAKPLLKDIIDKASFYCTTNSFGASLRFGHDGNIIPLAMLLHLQDSYNSVSEPTQFFSAWSDFKVAPMSANIQLIFYRKEGSELILVKFLQNENEVMVPLVQCYSFPFYNWSDVLSFYELKMNERFVQ